MIGTNNKKTDTSKPIIFDAFFYHPMIQCALTGKDLAPIRWEENFLLLINIRVKSPIKYCWILVYVDYFVSGLKKKKFQRVFVGAVDIFPTNAKRNDKYSSF